MADKKKDESPPKKKDEEEEILEEDLEEEEDVDADDQDADEEPPPPPEPTLDELKQLLEDTRAQLRRANRQAAERRIRLKELDSKKTPPDAKKDAEDGTAALQAALQAAEHKLRTFEMTEALSVELDALDLHFASAQARSDTLGFARVAIVQEFEGETVPEKEDLQDAIRQVLRTRPYLTAAKKKPGETDSKKRGSSDLLAIDEAEIAARYGIKPL